MRAVDAAYQILQESGQPMAVHDLLDEVARRVGQDPDARTLATMYSDINLDVRFSYRNEGLWALRDWGAKTATAASSGGGRDRPRAAVEPDDAEEEEGWA